MGRKSGERVDGVELRGQAGSKWGIEGDGLHVDRRRRRGLAPSRSIRSTSLGDRGCALPHVCPSGDNGVDCDVSRPTHAMIVKMLVDMHFESHDKLLFWHDNLFFSVTRVIFCKFRYDKPLFGHDKRRPCDRGEKVGRKCGESEEKVWRKRGVGRK